MRLRIRWGGLGLPGCAALLASCSSLNLGRPDVADLAREQAAYYEELGQLMEDDRELLAAGLDAQRKSEREKRSILAAWERALERRAIETGADGAEPVPPVPLLTELAERERGRARRASHEAAAAEERYARILALYDAVLAAVRALETGNAVLVEFLEQDDLEWALDSLDREALSTAASDLRALLEELRDARGGRDGDRDRFPGDRPR